MSMFSIGSNEVASLAAASRGGGGGGSGPQVDPIRLMEKQLELDLRRDQVNDKKMAEQSAKDEKRAFQMVAIEQAMAERNMALQAQQQRDFLEAQATTIRQTAESQFNAQLAYNKALLNEQEAGRISALKQVQADEAKNLKAQKELLRRQVEYAGESGSVAQLFEGAAALMGSYGARKLAVYQQTEARLARDVSMAFSSSADAAPEGAGFLARANRQSARLREGLLGEFNPVRVDPNGEMRGVQNTVKGWTESIAAVAGDFDNAKTEKVQNYLTEMVRAARDSDGDSFKAMREKLGAEVGPNGMAVLSSWSEIFSAQADKVLTDPENPGAASKLRKTQTYKSLEAFRGLMATEAGKTLYEGIVAPEKAWQHAYNGLQVAITKPGLTQQERDQMQAQYIETFTSQVVESYGIKDPKDAARIKGLISEGASRMLPLDQQRLDNINFTMETQSQADLAVAEQMFGSQATTIKSLTAAIDAIGKKYMPAKALEEIDDAEPAGSEQAPAGSGTSGGAVGPGTGDGGALL